MSNLIYEPISFKNIDEATKIQNLIFPNENGRLNFKQSLDKDFLEKTMEEWEVIKYFIVRDINKNAIGTVGYYSYKTTPKDGWVGWYGILESARGKGYGKEILLWLMDYLKNLGYEHMRLYTDLIDNKDAVILYKKLGMLEEKYLVENIPGNIVIFSKNIVGKETTSFNNMNLFLTKQIQLEKNANNL